MYRPHPNSQAPLRQAVGPGGDPILIQIPFSLFDLETWKNVAKSYQSDPVGITKRFQFLAKQHNPDWSDIQLLLDHMTETEKQLILKTAQDLANDHLKDLGEDIKDHFPLQDPHWDPNRGAHMRLLNAYRDWIIRGMERAIPKTINWSVLYAIRQGPKETPSEFLDKLRDTMRRHTPLDPGLEIGIQQLVSLFIGQSASDIQRKLQKLRPTESRNLETLLDEAWRVFSNREEEDRKKDKRALVAALQESKGLGVVVVVLMVVVVIIVVVVVVLVVMVVVVVFVVVVVIVVVVVVVMMVAVVGEVMVVVVFVVVLVVVDMVVAMAVVVVVVVVVVGWIPIVPGPFIF
ncbi:hypothetical protein llap_15720 [Limosa lapponica baueri]|uniref:Core shell protein Gag P30 domain-containing protein n=1 Tax=Limosa lapponica baueri TaxID=1758121 RepID=A0A2I0TJJ4_LIMLA|nr:hypothetical protein llap_15720 [Limosa lapponica baueri]